MTQQGGPNWGPQGPGMQQPNGWGAPPPPKKKRWPWIVGGIVLLLVVIGIAGGGNKGSSTPTAADSTSSATATAPAAPPATVSANQQGPASTPAPAGTVQGWRLESLDYKATQFAQTFEGTARVTNTTNKSVSAAAFKVTLLNGTSVIATMDGSVSNTGPGQTVTVSLFSTDAFQPGQYTADLQVTFSF